MSGARRIPSYTGGLMLTRRVGETVIIGGVIEVTVIGRIGNEIKLAIKAPKEVNVVRKELTFNVI